MRHQNGPLDFEMTFPAKPSPDPGPPRPQGMAGLPLDSVPIGIALSQRGIYLQANAAFLDLFGYESEAQVLGRSILDVMEAGHRELVWARNQEREKSGSGPAEYEAVGLRTDGSTFPVQIHVATIPMAEGMGTLAFITDLSERKGFEARLQESEERFRTYVEQSIDVIFTLDAEGIITFLSPAWERHFGIPAKDILGHSFVPLVHPEDVEPCLQYLQRVMATGKAETSPVYRVRHADGSWRRLAANGSRMSMPSGEPQFLGVSRDISEEQAAQEALLEAHQFNEQIIHGAEVGIIIYGPDLRYRVWNRFMERLTGLSASRVLGTLPLETFPYLRGQGALDRLERALAGEEVGSLDIQFIHPATGAPTWTTNTSVPFRNKDGEIVGVIASVVNITNRKLAEQAVLDSEKELQVIFETSDAGIILVSPQGRILFANRRMGELLGMTGPTLMGTRYTDYLHEAEKEIGDGYLQQIISGQVQSVSLERRYVRADGTDFWGHLSGRRLEHPDGSLRALVGVITDTSDRRLAEEQQRFLQAQLYQAQKMESLGALAGGVAHDMNNVLGAILGLASAHIEAQPPGSPTQKAFGTIMKAAERGGNMLKSLLSFARQNSAEDRDLDLNTILREEVRLLERTTLSKVYLVMDLDPRLRLIRADPGALTHAFMNLCVNAVDAMPEKGTLTLRTRNHGPDWIEVQVQDTGTGMPPEVLARALDPFFTTKEVGKGTGLGLSIVYSTVKAYQGEMELQSVPGQGTCVSLRFPAIHEPIRPAEPSGVYQTMPRLGALDVLLVDDDELIRSSIQGMLERLGHRVTLARNGEEALALLLGDDHPDVVILDMNMPGLGGAGTLPRLRQLRPGVPVLLATGRADQSAQDLVQSHPFVTLLSKPFGMKELQAHLAPYAG